MSISSTSVSNEVESLTIGDEKSAEEKFEFPNLLKDAKRSMCVSFV